MKHLNRKKPLELKYEEIMMKINDMEKTAIKIKMVLVNGGNPSFVEFFSYSDSRTHIINAERFCSVFGYTIEDLNQFHVQGENR
jgi:hypothetical protein